MAKHHKRQRKHPKANFQPNDMALLYKMVAMLDVLARRLVEWCDEQTGTGQP
jgi:hypothetical protein